MNMTGSKSDRCGYTWQQNELGEIPHHQNCCWRETIVGSEHCIWHSETEAVPKSIDELQKMRLPPEVREKTSVSIFGKTLTEILDGAKLSGMEIEDAISFAKVTLRDADLSNANLVGANISGADLSGANLSYATLGKKIGGTASGADLSESLLKSTQFSSASLKGVNLSNAYLSDADLSGANLWNADCSMAVFSQANLSNAYLEGANLSKTSFQRANLSNANLEDADLSNANLEGSDLSDASLKRANLSNANLEDANLSNADLEAADLTDAILSRTDLIGTILEHAVLIRTNLFNSNLTNCRPHGATFTDVQINDNTEFRSEEQRRADKHTWQKGPFLPPNRCGYDPEITDKHGETVTEQLGKAADTYQTFEKLARENALPSVQSDMFVLRQDMQRKRYWHNKKPLKWSFAGASSIVFKYGESLGRIVAWAVTIIVAYAGVYGQFDLIRTADNQFVGEAVDALYFSTLTFTTLGLGDFQPDPNSELARLLVTSQAALGAILIAIFVFVLGRRAAR